MKTTLENLSRGGQRYEAPALEVIELNTENVICQDSSKFGINPWENDEDPLNW